MARSHRRQRLEGSAVESTSAEGKMLQLFPRSFQHIAMSTLPGDIVFNHQNSYCRKQQRFIRKDCSVQIVVVRCLIAELRAPAA